MRVGNPGYTYFIPINTAFTNYYLMDYVSADIDKMIRKEATFLKFVNIILEFTIKLRMNW